VSFVTSPIPTSPSFVATLPGRRCSPSFFPKGLQIACQLNHNRDSGSRDNLASGYRGVSSQRPKPKVSTFTYRYEVNVGPGCIGRTAIGVAWLDL